MTRKFDRTLTQQQLQAYIKVLPEHHHRQAKQELKVLTLCKVEALAVAGEVPCAAEPVYEPFTVSGTITVGDIIYTDKTYVMTRADQGIISFDNIA